MAAGDFAKWFNESGETLIEELLAERYEPQAEKQFEIPKPKGVDSCYADDFVIFVRSQKAGERVKESVIRFIKDNLQLKISEAKSKVCHIEEATFLGHTIFRKRYVSHCKRKYFTVKNESTKNNSTD